LGAVALDAAGLEATAFSAAFAVFFSISLLLFLEDFAADGLAVEDLAVDNLPVDDLTAADLAGEVLALDDLADPRAVLADPRARFLGVLRLAAVDFPAPFEILFLRVFCDTACARQTLAPLFKIFHENPSGPKRRREQGPACWMRLTIAHFLQKSMVYARTTQPLPGFAGQPCQ
jgi:hypothetical protein